MSYRFLDHATDAMIEATAPTLEEAFLKAAEATVEVALDASTVKELGQTQVSVSGSNLDRLLFNWLDEVIYMLITEGFAVRKFDVKISQNGDYRLDAVMSGEPLDLKRHRFRVEIKAPTFHCMEILQDNAVTIRFLLDL